MILLSLLLPPLFPSSLLLLASVAWFLDRALLRLPARAPATTWLPRPTVPRATPSVAIRTRIWPHARCPLLPLPRPHPLSRHRRHHRRATRWISRLLPTPPSRCPPRPRIARAPNGKALTQASATALLPRKIKTRGPCPRRLQLPPLFTNPKLSKPHSFISSISMSISH